MRWSSVAAGVLALSSTAAAQADSAPYTDEETGIAFQSFTDPETSNISFRVALPQETNSTYDVILQIEAPADIGWVGWAWGGSMTYNPLTIIWPNGEEVVHSPRMAYGYYVPTAYENSTYTVLKGTGVSGGKMKFTAVCSGCTSWSTFEGDPQSVDASLEARFAFAYSQNPVDTPADPASGFSIHDLVGHWYHDLPGAKSAEFDTWVAENTVA